MAALSFEEVQAMGYSDVRQRSDGSWCGIMKFMFTYAIVSDIHAYGYEDRWCYSSLEKAKGALEAWPEDQDEPAGWHRHPLTGRRVNANGVVTVNF